MISLHSRRLAAVISFCVVSFVTQDASAAVGRTVGQFGVSPTGEAQYSIELWTPPGIRGMQPNLGLSYSSRGGPGHFGVGWRLTGLSSIYRCPKTWAQDGLLRDVRNDWDDRFCMDGNQLRLTSGNYGIGGSTYQTELETFSRITAAGISGNGPQWFNVEGKDGLWYGYGVTGDSRIESIGQSTVRAWAVNEIHDRAGNTVRFTYTEDTTNGSYRPNTISYTENTVAGVSPHYLVTFFYESIPAGEIDSGYLAGSEIQRIKRVDRIDITHDGALVRRYELTYESGLPSTSRSRLASIQECAGTTPDCFPATTFTYQNGTSGLSAETAAGITVPLSTFPWSLDVNGDGRKDLVYSSTATSGSGYWMVALANTSGGYNTPASTTVVNTNFVGATPIDYNADGLADLLIPLSGTWWVMLGSASGVGLLPAITTGAPATGTGSNARALDIDGDGRQDLVWAELFGWGGGDTIKYRLRLPSGGFSATSTTLVGPMPQDWIIEGPLYPPNTQSVPSRVADFNGDGRGDVVYRQKRRVYEPDFQGYIYFATTFNVICPGGMTFSAVIGNGAWPYYGDFNGDGRTDVLYIEPGVGAGYRIRHSTGTGFTGEYAGPSISSFGSPDFVLDWDGDGFDDLLVRHVSSSTLYLFRSTGEGFAAGVSTGISSTSSNMGGLVVTDINADGLSDLAYWNASGAWQVRKHLGLYPDLLLTATDGFGLTTTFNYVPITQNNYTKYADAAFPDQDYIGPMYIVSSVTAPSGTQSPTTYTLSYWYYGARQHLQGRGFEGFIARRTLDSRNSLVNYQYFRRDFPYTGLVYQDDLVQPNDVTLIRRVNNTFSSLTAGAGFETRLFPYTSLATSDNYEFGGTRNGAWMARETRNATVDTFGNPTNITTSTQDKDTMSPWYGETFSTALTNTITNNTTYWCIGVPSQTTLQSTLPDATSQTRTQSAIVDYPNCRMTQKVIEPFISALTVTTTFEFDVAGNIKKVHVIGNKPDGTDLPTRTTELNYGTRYQLPETLINPLNQQSTIAYRYDLGLKSTITDPNGLATSYLYDDFARQSRETRTDSTYTTWTRAACDSSNNYCGVPDLRYDLIERQYTNTGVLIRSAYLYHDGFDRLRYDEQQNLTGGLTYVVTQYDALGRTSLQYVPYSTSSNGTRRWTYDAISRVTADGLYTAGGALDRQTTYAYTGRFVTVTDPKSNATNRYIDVRGQLRRVVDPSPGGTTNYAFDPFGNLTTATDPAGNNTSFGYNLRGFTTSSNDPDRGGWTYAPNSLGEPVSQTDAKGQTVTFGNFDLLGRPTTRNEFEGLTTFTWGTSAAAKNIGRLQSLSGPGYLESYVYDSLSRPQMTTYTADTTYQVNYAYQLTTGYLDSITYPTSTAGYRLRAQYLYQFGILNQVRDYNAPSTVWWQLNAMDDRGNPVDEQLGNGVHIVANNDVLTGHLNWRTSGSNPSYNNHQNLTFQWDKNENLTDRIDVNQSSLTEHFVYDSMNRLDYSTLNGSTNLDVTLDAIGNITYRWNGPSDFYNYTYHATRKHAVASTSNGWTFTYDNNGNMQTGRGSTITWTSYNLPASITNGSQSAQFSYTPDRRYWRQIAQYGSGPETTIYIGGILEKVSGATATDYRHYIRAGSATVIVTRSTGTNNNTYYVTQDHLGSSTAVTNGTGTLLVNESFGAYGGRRGSNWQGTPTTPEMTSVAITSRRGFTGHTMLDNLSLIHMNGRVYDPLIGRFLSADPFIDGWTDSQGYNRYSYVGNNPLTFIDPSGFTQRPPGSPPGGIPGETPGAGEDRGWCWSFCGFWNRSAGDFEKPRRPVPNAHPVRNDRSKVIPANACSPDVMPCSPNPIDWRKVALATHVFLNTASVVLDATVLGGAISWVPDVLDGMVSVAEGDLTGALISAGSAIPYIGNVGNAAKIARAGARYADEVASVAKTCCFIAGTLVVTSTGLKAIEQVAVGDQVLSRDEKTGETAFKPVTELIRRHEREIWELKLKVAEAGAASMPATFETTDDHPWRTADGRWLQTMELKPGMEIQRADGNPARIMSVVKTDRTASTYNLEVADFHTYFVGHAQIWVHNACNPSGAANAADEARATVNAQQAANLARFEKKLPKGAGPTIVRDLPGGGKVFQSEVPGRVPGSKAVYEKQVDANGMTTQYTKTTYDPAGNIAHAKDKITGEIFP